MTKVLGGYLKSLKVEEVEPFFDIFSEMICQLTGEANLDKRMRVWGLLRILFDIKIFLWVKGLKLTGIFKSDLDLALKTGKSVKVFGKIEEKCKNQLKPQAYQKIFGNINMTKLYEKLEREKKEKEILAQKKAAELAQKEQSQIQAIQNPAVLPILPTSTQMIEEKPAPVIQKHETVPAPAPQPQNSAQSLLTIKPEASVAKPQTNTLDVVDPPQPQENPEASTELPTKEETVSMVSEKASSGPINYPISQVSSINENSLVPSPTKQLSQPTETNKEQGKPENEQLANKPFEPDAVPEGLPQPSQSLLNPVPLLMSHVPAPPPANVSQEPKPLDNQQALLEPSSLK